MTALDLLNGLVLDDGRRWGEVAVDWQRADARAVLEPGPGDPRLHWLGRPKGGSKTTDLAGMTLAWLESQAPPLAAGYAVAADRDQANRLLDQARGFVARTPALRSVIKVEAHRIVNVANGARVHALEADVAGSEGLLSPWFVIDELPNWAETPTAQRMWTSVVSGLPKVPACRLVVIGHAGAPEHWAFRVLEVARAEGWRVVEIPGPLPWVSEADLDMQRALLLPSDFERRHMNRWTSADDRLSTLDDVRACVTHDGPLPSRAGVSYVITLDLGLKRDRTVATVAHAEWGPTGLRVIVDRLEVWKGTPFAPVRIGDVESWLLQAHGSYGGRLVLDPWQTVGLAQRMRERGLQVEEFPFTSQSVGRLGASLFRVLRDRMIGLPDDAELIDELAHVRLRETQPGVYRLDHDSGRHDDRAVAIALAVQALLTEEPGFEPFATRYVIPDPTRGGADPTTDRLIAMAEASGDPRFAVEHRPMTSWLDGRR